MGKIIFLMGKSTTGKDTIYKNILGNNKYSLKKVVPYTTRPMRDGEADGVQYFFLNEDGYERLKNDRKIIEERTYNTQYGPWRYFTVDDGQIDLENSSSLMIGTLESYISISDYYGKENVIPIYIQIPDRLRLERGMHREEKQDNPRYDEMCRRFLADNEDFSEEKLENAGINKRFNNDRSVDECINDIYTYISKFV